MNQGAKKDQRWGRVRQRLLTQAASARPGQTLVVFALTSVVLLGALGLVLDGGYLLVQRRTLQNAADAAALKGTQDVQLNVAYLRNTLTGILTLTPPPSVYDDIRVIAMQNGLGDPNDPDSGATLTCEFVGNPVLGLDLTTLLTPVLGDCNGGSRLLPIALPIPPLATGVKVTVTERHKTLLMGVLGTPTAGTSATATAQVHLPNQDAITADAGAFIVCGVNTRLPTQFPDLGGLLGGIGLGSSMSVLMTDPLTGAVANPPQINPAAIGQTFVVHGSTVANCGLRANSNFNGLNDPSANLGQVIPESGAAIKYKVTGRPSSTNIGAIGPNACVNGQLNNCVMLLPIADALPVTNNCVCIHAISYAAFWITEVDANTHTGKLIWPYSVQASGQLTWTPSQIPGLLIIKLTR